MVQDESDKVAIPKISKGILLNKRNRILIIISGILISEDNRAEAGIIRHDNFQIWSNSGFKCKLDEDFGASSRWRTLDDVIRSRGMKRF